MKKIFYNQLVEVRKRSGRSCDFKSNSFYLMKIKRVEKAVSSLKNNDFDTFKQVIKDSGDSSYKYLQNVYSNKYPDNKLFLWPLLLSVRYFRKSWCMSMFMEVDLREQFKPLWEDEYV